MNDIFVLHRLIYQGQDTNIKFTKSWNVTTRPLHFSIMSYRIVVTIQNKWFDDDNDDDDDDDRALL